MKKCRNCGGENSNSEIYCDWCGEFLPSVEKITIFTFIKNYFHSFAILGVFGAIIFYIANFLNNNQNSDFLGLMLLGISLKNVLQTGLFVCFMFFILLLILLIIELLKVSKEGITLKILLFILLYLLIFSILLLLFIGKDWLGLIILVVVANLFFIIYMEIYYKFLQKSINIREKSRKSGIFGLISMVLFIFVVLLIPSISSLITFFKGISLPYETEPRILGMILDSVTVGTLIGLLFGIIFWTITNYIEIALDVKKKCERTVQTLLTKIRNR